jgi:hypothetical protein
MRGFDLALVKIAVLAVPAGNHRPLLQ